MKALTRKQLEHRKAQAAHFALDVRQDDELAAEIEDESLEEYVEKRHIKLTNPKGALTMAIQTRRELVERIKELEEENEDLQSRLEEIGDLASTDEADESEDDDSGE